MSEQHGNAGDAGSQGALSALSEALDGADALDADARLELLGRVQAGIAAELDGLDGL